MSVFVSPQSTQRTEPVMIGIDVGSTTVKAVVVDPQTKRISVERLPATPDQASRVRARLPAANS
jgi:activator of 2-hydroxyglutaryl-CoA dehydratase